MRPGEGSKQCDRAEAQTGRQMGERSQYKSDV